MVTYRDFDRIVKEPVEIDSDPQKRWTPQKVKFINNGNEFYGTFIGNLNVRSLSCNDVWLSNVNLFKCKLYDHEGTEIKLDDIVERGMIYRGLLSTDIISSAEFDSLSCLFDENQKYNPELSTKQKIGSLYVIRGSYRKYLSVDEVTLGNNDMLIVSKTCDISSVSRETVNIIDSQDKNVVHFDELEKELGNYVSLSGEQCISGYKTFSRMSVDTFEIEDGKIQKSKISGLDSDIMTLSDSIFGENQISDKVQFLLSVGHDSMEYKNELSGKDKVLSLSDFLIFNGYLSGGFIKRGFMYRTAVDNQTLSSCERTLKLCNNDYIIFNKNVLVSCATLSDVDVIYDASVEGKQLSDDLSTLRDYVFGLSSDAVLTSEGNQVSVITNLNQASGLVSISARTLVSSDVEGLSDWVKARIEDLDVSEISCLGNQVIEKIWETDGKISATTRTLMSNDISGLSEYVGRSFQNLCSMVFVLSNENNILCSNNYYGLQKYSNLSSEEITVPYAKLKDVATKKLSDLIQIEPYFESLYSGIAEAVSYVNVYCKKKIEFNVGYDAISAYDVINTLGDELGVEISPRLSGDSEVSAGFLALQKIIDESNLSIDRNLEDELKQINLRFDNLEQAVANHTKHYNRTFEKDVEVQVDEKPAYFDMLKMTDEKNNGKQYTMHLSGGTIVLVPNK